MSLALYVNTAGNTLLTSLSSAQAVPPASLPFFYGDDYVPLEVFLMEPDPEANPLGFPFSIIPTTGITLTVALTQGIAGGTVYTQNVAWTTDANSSYFIGNLPMSTADLATLLGSGQIANAYLQIAATIAGYRQTVFSGVTTIGAGLPAGALVVPQGMTPLSVQAAGQMFVPFIGAPGQGIVLTSPNGKEIQGVAVDNLDGTASLQWNPIN